MGNVTLFRYLNENREHLNNPEIINLFKKAVDDLLRFQTDGIKEFPIKYARPVSGFDKRSVMFDLNYFKYSFVKTNEITFDENKLEDDFERFAEILLQADSNYFMYRDFQSRNIMMHNDQYWYIDFQGGRKGPLQYDLISLIFQAGANLPEEVRESLYGYYIEKLNKKLPHSVDDFEKYYSDFVFFRLMQVLGAYGFRGLFQRKGHFLESIYPALNILETQLDKRHFTAHLPELNRILENLIKRKEQYKPVAVEPEKLTVEINSFSYKKGGVPYDFSTNGGGFVFDCRALPNPGRLAELRDFTGKDIEVVRYLEQFKEIDNFKKNNFNLVDQSINNYLKRGFSRLQVNFGCTGGKHRSVYMAEALKKHLKNRPELLIVVRHMGQDKL